MNILYLISFLEIVKQNSISKASKNLHLTQSALSQQLVSLENSLGVTLLIRSNKGIKLTPSGEIVLGYAEAIVNLNNSMNRDLLLLKNSLLHEIKISSCNSVSEYLLPCTLHEFRKRHSNFKFLLKTDHSKNIIEQVLDFKADIGFIDSATNIAEIESYMICTSKLSLIYSPKRNICGDIITINEISKLPLILKNNESSLRTYIEHLFTQNNIPLHSINIEMELDTFEAIKASVIANHGVSLVPYITVKKEIYSNILKTIEIKEVSPCCNIYMIYNKNRVTQHHIQEFINYIKDFGRNTFC